MLEVMPERAAVLAATKYVVYLRGESGLRQRVGRMGASRWGRKIARYGQEDGRFFNRARFGKSAGHCTI